MIATHQLEILVKMRDEATRRMERMGREVKALTLNMKTLGWAGGIVAGTLAALGTTIAIKGIKAFEESEVEMMRFETRLKALPPYLQAFREEILEAADKAIYLGFSSETAAKNIVHLLGITGDMKNALKLWGLAMDLARYKGIDLDTAVRAVGLAWGGNTRLLKEFGIEIDENASKTTVMTALTRVVEGASKNYIKTLQGQREALGQVVDESWEWIGTLIVKNLRIKETIQRVIEWVKVQGGIQEILERNKVLIYAIAGVLGAVFLVAIIAVVAALKALIGVFVLVGLKITAIILALTALGVAFWFFVNQIIEGMTTLYPIFVDTWERIKDYFWKIVDWFSRKWDELVSKITWFLDKLKEVKEKIGGFFEGVAEKTGGVVGKVGEVIGLQEGGIVTRPTLARIGERGPEAVLPLERLKFGTVNIYLSGTFLTEKEVAEKWANQIARIIKYQLRI